MSKIPVPVIVLIAILVTVGLVASQHAVAAPSVVTFNVDTQLDLIDADTTDGTCLAGSCSLRAAIMQANVLTGPGVTIIVPSGTYTLTRPPAGPNDPDNGDLNLTAPPNGSDPLISIIGAGADSTFVDANLLDRVLVVESGRRASISGLTIRHGLLPSAGSGGGIYNAGTLTLTQVTLSDNRAGVGGGLTNSSGTLMLIRSTLNANQADYGGGIYNPSGTLSVAQSTISGNIASYSGGGIDNFSSQLATVIQSTLSSNFAAVASPFGGGGGIYNSNSASLVVVNSTLSQNSANNNGGGIWNSGLVNLYSSSVVFNLADADADVNGGNGGGIWNSRSFSIRHTLVAGNTATDPQAGFDDCTGTLNAYGWNLFWVVNGCTVNTYNSTWGTLSSLAVIGPLQNNGGPTWTHALLASSNPIGNPIDSGGLPAACVDTNSVPLTTDQRGALRSVDGDGDGVARCDIGAYEYQPPLLLPLIRR